MYRKDTACVPAWQDLLNSMLFWYFNMNMISTLWMAFPVSITSARVNGIEEVVREYLILLIRLVSTACPITNSIQLLSHCIRYQLSMRLAN